MKTVVNFTVKATITTDDAKTAKEATKELKETLSNVYVSSANDTKIVVKQVKE